MDSCGSQVRNRKSTPRSRAPSHASELEVTHGGHLHADELTDPIQNHRLSHHATTSPSSSPDSACAPGYWWSVTSVNPSPLMYSTLCCTRSTGRNVSVHFEGTPETCVTLPLAAATSEWGNRSSAIRDVAPQRPLPPWLAPTPTVAVAVVPDHCQVEVKSLGSKNKTDPFFANEGADCIPYPSNAPSDTYAIASVYITEESIHAPAMLVGQGRLRAHVRTASDGSRVARHPDQDQVGALVTPSLHISRTSFFDAQPQVMCTVRELPDQTMRCIPFDVRPLTGGMFADPNCSNPIAYLRLRPHARQPSALPRCSAWTMHLRSRRARGQHLLPTRSGGKYRRFAARHELH